jgi:hypothetical protein
MRSTLSCTRRLGLLFLVALTIALPAGLPVEVYARDRAAQVPDRLWRMFPLGPRRKTHYQPRLFELRRPHAAVGAVAITRVAAPAQTSGGGSGGSFDFGPLGWLLAGFVAITAALAVVLAERGGIGASRLASVASSSGIGSRSRGWKDSSARAPAWTAADLGELSRRQLYQLAAERGIDGRSQMSRERLIEALIHYREGPT